MSTRDSALPLQLQARSVTAGRRFLDAVQLAVRRNRLLIPAAMLLAGIVLAGVCAPLIVPHDPYSGDISRRLLPPAWLPGGNWQYPLGTDALGRDLLSRMIYGARISLLVGVVAVLVRGSLGVILGLVAGYYGGRLDSVIMRIGDIQLAIPFLVLAISVMAVLGAGLRNVVLVLGVTGWIIYGRVVRGEVLSVREKEYVQAARVLGATDGRILARHIFPNVRASIIVVATLEVARMIIAEASLSYLGLGVQPPIPSWGGMVADGRDFLSTQWWVSTFPGLAIFVTVMAINLIGDTLRDLLDPTTRGKL